MSTSSDEQPTDFDSCALRIIDPDQVMAVGQSMPPDATVQTLGETWWTGRP